MTEQMADGGPFEEEELRDFYDIAKKSSIKDFDKVAVGEVKEEFLDNLRKKMKARY
jgi:hypothetical protein